MLKLGKLVFFALFLLTIGSCAHVRANFQQKAIPRASFVKVEKSLSVKTCADGMGCTEKLLKSVASGVVVHGTLAGAYVLTAAHVCDNSDVMAKYMTLPNVKFSAEFVVRALDDDRKRVEIIKQNSEHDVCIVWVPNLFAQPIIISPTAPKPGDRVYNIAAPLGIFSKNMVPVFEGFYNGTDEEGHAIYSLPAIGGSSGSPIVNKKGELIGMIHSVIRYYNQISISPNYKAMREFINESISDHTSRSYFHSVWRSFRR